MAITMDIAKAIIRREHKGKVAQEDINTFIASITTEELNELMYYAIEWNEKLGVI